MLWTEELRQCEMVILRRESLQDGGFEMFGEKEDRVFCVIPGTDASNKDNGTHLSPNGSVTQSTHFWWQVPTAYQSIFSAA